MTIKYAEIAKKTVVIQAIDTWLKGNPSRK
jgi:hypothetical protein